MPKIYYENGLLAEFNSHDELSNEDIFIHGLSNVNIGNLIVYSAKQGPIAELPEEAKKAMEYAKVVDIESRRPPKQEPKEASQEARPIMRRATPPPKEEPKLGFMCPHCHQSRIVFLDIEPIYDPTTREHSVIIESLDLEPRFIYATMKEYAIALAMDNNLIHLSDKEIGPMLPSPWRSIQDTLTHIEKDTYGCCDGCRTISPLQLWINEFAQPTTPYFHTCRICGGEMDFTCEAGTFNHRADNQEIKCEKCGYATTYNIGSR